MTLGLRPERHDPDLVEAIYHCVLDPEGWSDVMAQLGLAFPSSAQTFYFLERDTGHVRPITLRGIELGLLPHFDELYFAPDNPCMWVSKQKHRPGVVRTNERLEEHLRRTGDLYRSSYYNEWLRPQGLHYMIGNTLATDGALVANVTLMRPADMPTFDAAEVRRFEHLTRHMQRALQVGSMLETRAAGGDPWSALAALPVPVALVDTQLVLRYANPAMEALLCKRRALVARDGRLLALDVAAQQHFEQAVRGATETPSATVWLPVPGSSEQLALEVAPVGLRPGSLLPRQSLVLLTAQREAMSAVEIARVLRDCHHCTRSEAELGARLACGCLLREAAAELGISYGSARIYLKGLFLKLDVHSQAQLVAALTRLGHG